LDDLIARIDELAKKDTDAAGRLAEEVLLALGDEAAALAKAFCAWGGVRRVQADWAKAEWAYEQAESLLRMTGAGPAEWLDWHSRMLFLRRDQRCLAEALDHAESMLNLSRELRDPIRMARTLVDEALVARLIDRDVAKKLAGVALDVLPESDLAYRRSALHVLLGCLCYADSPDLDELDRRLDEVRALGDSPESSPSWKLVWFEGLAKLRRGQPSEAVPRLRSSYDGLLKLRVHGYAAACALDLAEAHLADGDPDAAAQVAGLLFPIFGALRHEPGATAALRLFCRAVEEKKLDIDVVREARERLEASGVG
jgi:hypothetical protein